MDVISELARIVLMCIGSATTGWLLGYYVVGPLIYDDYQEH